jgi:hypothetical protein
MKRLIWLPIAGFLLVAGAAVAAAAAPTITNTANSILNSPASTTSPDATPGPEEETDEQTDDGINSLWGKGIREGANDVLESVLADLVAQGVITQEQSDAIVEAIGVEIDERKAEFEAMREEMKETWELIRTFLEDGVITQEEVNQLPEDSPFRQVFDSIAQDGEVSLEELRQLGPNFGGPGPRLFHHRGDGAPGRWFEMVAPDFDWDADSNPDSESDSGSGSSTNS